MTLPKKTILDLDRERLQSTAIAALANKRTAVPASMLLSEIARATIVTKHTLPPGVVTMNCEVEVHDHVKNTKRRLCLRYPEETAGEPGSISVLTSFGATLLGSSEGDSIDWCTPSRERRSITILRARHRYGQRSRRSALDLDTKDTDDDRRSHRVSEAVRNAPEPILRV
jgi:regulator of nucleoside diphosphate kinase